MTRLQQVITLIVILLWPSPGISANKTVSLAVLNWEPYVGEELENMGFGAEIISEAFSRSGYKTKLHFMPWVRALRDTVAGKYDAVCFGYYSEKRDKIYALSKPFAESSLVFYSHKDSDISYSKLADLKPYRIGVVRGFVNTAEFDAAQYLRKDVVSSETINLRKLLYKRIDLILIDRYVARYLIQKIFQNNITDFKELSPPLQTQPLYIMFSRTVEGYELKLQAFNNGLQLIAGDGTIDKILAKHGIK